MELLQRSPAEGLARPRAHAIELARAEVTAALQKLHDDSPNLDPGVLKQRRSQVLLQLKRVAPGRATAFAAVEDIRGDICTDGPGIAGAAGATVIAYFIALLVCAGLGRRHLPLPLPWNDWVRAAAATGIMAAAVYALPAINSAWLMLVAQAMTGAIVYVASALALNIADCRSWLADARALMKPAGAQS